MRSMGGVFDRIGPREQKGRGFNRDQSGGPRRDVFGRGRLGSESRGGKGWRNDRHVETTSDRRVYNRTDSDMMEEDSSSILLVSM